MVGEHTILLIILSTLLLTVGAAGYTLGKLLRTLASRSVYITKLEEHDRMIRANSVLIHAIAEEYEPAPEPPGAHHCHLPDGWKVYG